MKDQAESLRRQLRLKDHVQKTKAIAVVSGKGGVGKSNFSLNFSISLSKVGKKVLVLDMDIGMGNIDILIGKSAEKSIVDYLNGHSALEDIITHGPEGIHYIAGGTGLTQLVQFDKEQTQIIMDDLQHQVDQYDYVIFDMGAGINENTLKFILSVQEVIVITTPEPTSLTDAYATIKYIHLQDANLPFHIVVNRAQSDKEGMETIKRLQEVLKRFLNKEAFSLGILPDDRAVQTAVRRQIPFLLHNPKSHAAKALEEISKSYDHSRMSGTNKENEGTFISKLRRFLFER